MARRKSSRRRSFNLRKVRVNGATAIGALASLDVATGAFVPVSSTPYRAMSIEISWAVSNLGAGIDDGQEFGVSHSDYSAAEVEECLESTASIDVGDKIAIERGNRLVRSIGVMTGSAANDFGISFNDGVPKKTKLNWYIGSDDAINVWVRNGSGTVYTTGASLIRNGIMWVKQPA